jgi:hypothetical protein
MTYKRNFIRLIFLIFMLAFFFQISCKKGDDPNSDIPYANINVVINPNSTLYQELNTVGGWLYYQWVDAPSRGLIVYRLSIDEFKAYERTPPVNSNGCCDLDNGFCTALLVDDYYPFVYDTCSDFSYSIIDGSPYGEATIPLKSYRTVYDGLNLYITN